MSLAWTLLLTAAFLAAAVYAQLRLPFHTSSGRQALTARLLLLAVGIAFGAVMTRVYTSGQEGSGVIAFLNGFGLVHVPAAAILFLKRQRAKG